MGACTMHLRLASSCRDRFRRLGWLGLWMVGKHAMRIWMTTPTATRERMDWRLGAVAIRAQTAIPAKDPVGRLPRLRWRRPHRHLGNLCQPLSSPKRLQRD